MRYPRVSAYILNVVFLLVFAVAATVANPANTDPVVGFGVVFLALLLGVYLIHWSLRRRPGALKMVKLLAVAGAFAALTAMGDHVVIGLAAAVLMLVDLSVLPKHVVAVSRPEGHPAARKTVRIEDDTTHDPAGSYEEFRDWQAWREERAARSVH